MIPDQTAFHAALLDGAHPVPDGLTDGQNRPAGRRYNVYRNNIAVSLGEALATGFPVIAKLLGPQNFDGIAAIYLRAHPPQSPLMMQYGQDFPDFLAGFAALSHLGYLADVARLELALRAAYHAADAQPVDPAMLQSISPETLMAAHIRLAPAVRLVRSDWPIFDIWRYNTEENAPKPQAGAQDVLITRPEFDPAPHLLPPGGAAWIAALSDHTFGAAHDIALKENPNFDLGTALGLLVQGNAMTDIISKDIP